MSSSSTTIVLTPSAVKLYTGEFDLAVVFQLFVQGKNIRSPLDCLERCVNLRLLDLSHNSITGLGSGLRALALLESVDLCTQHRVIWTSNA